MLFDITNGCHRVESEDLKNMRHYQAFIQKAHPSTVKAVFQKINSFLDSQKPSTNNQLIWVRLAKMMGRKSASPHKDIVYVEEAVEKAVGDGKNFLLLCGLLFMITIAEREEKHWLCHKVETDDIDPESGKFIAWRGYWINTDFVAPK